VTGDRELAARIKVLRTHGWKRKYFPKELGYNSRLDALQAAILRAKLAHVDEWNNRRREIAGLYNRALADFYWHIPHERPLARHVFHLYAIRIKGRDQIRQYLKQEGIASGIYYPMPPYLAEPCHSLGNCAGDFPCSDQVSREMLALPLYPEMSSNQQGIVINALLTRQRKSQVGF
jgi:dTDP-4-amino-4,6-dideoxygalactose transaminase